MPSAPRTTRKRFGMIRVIYVMIPDRQSETEAQGQKHLAPRVLHRRSLRRKLKFRFIARNDIIIGCILGHFVKERIEIGLIGQEFVGQIHIKRRPTVTDT